MAQNYQKIGDYISVVDNRNTDGSITNLMGISIDKCYIPSVANVIGTDLHNYKVIRKGQFACSLMQVSRDQRIPLAMYTSDEPAIMSPAYVMFEVSRPDELLPEYLELWFKRAEFDREASFYAVGGVRGSLDWEDFRKMKLPVPSLPEQRKIVHDYQAITDRIELLRKINENLEEQASLHFESVFGRYIPDGLNVSSTIPDGWTVATIGDFCKANSATFSGKEDVLLYLDTGSITNNYIIGLQTLNTNTDEIPSRARRKVSNGDIVYSTVRPNLRHYGIIFNPPANMIVSTGFAVMSMIKNAPVCSEIIYMWLTRIPVVNVLNSIAENSVSTYPSIVSADLEQIKMIVPSEDVRAETGAYYKSVFQTIDCNNREISKLKRLAMLFSNQLAKEA